MKKLTIILLFLSAISLQVSAQIPNSGFENWVNKGNYMEPEGYLTGNSNATTSFYPVTRSTDHYPLAVGSYSIRIESKTSLLPNADGLGIALQNRTGAMLAGPGVSFPVSGHPASLTGYFKYAPLNGDSMMMSIQLFKSGTSVSRNTFITGSPTTSWTAFNIPFPSYTTADSGSFMFASYFADGPPPEYIPKGNSVLYIDNLNFDNLIINGVSEMSEKDYYAIYPNPAQSELTISSISGNFYETDLVILNAFGQEVYTKKTTGQTGVEKLDITQLLNGVYFIQLISNDGIYYRSKIVVAR